MYLTCRKSVVKRCRTREQCRLPDEMWVEVIAELEVLELLNALRCSRQLYRCCLERLQSQRFFRVLLKRPHDSFPRFVLTSAPLVGTSCSCCVCSALTGGWQTTSCAVRTTQWMYCAW